MKFLRIGNVRQEIPVALDNEGKYRNLSSVIKDLNPESINFETLEKIKEMYRDLVTDGHGNTDHSSLYNAIEKINKK